ncbi:MAG: hypothetical protein COW08_01440 [Ignavibacteriales bacterium CG12_big_fil_rev_8_21_14_0_65_30_8]|nr:MAG: hypothetical protein COW08_01440 [Ignavibacteriales bacterium CG12_big_fil_rev_8_21_14_0_65_30_8]
MKLKYNSIVALIILFTVTCPSQIKKPLKLIPVDQSYKDNSLLKFKKEVFTAIDKKDTNFIISILDTNILNSFGGNGGIKEFWEMWQMQDPNSSFWLELKKVFSMGGIFISNERKIFVMPYLFGIWPEDLDPFTYIAAINKNVAIHESPSKNSKILKKINYDILLVLDYYDEYNNWKKVMTVDSLSGFVQKEFVRSPIDYRAILQKEKGKWKITSFVSGD